MPTRHSAISSNLYAAFCRVPEKAWADIVRLYESNRKGVASLSSLQRLEILARYIFALHELKDYKTLIREVDDLIAFSLSEDVAVRLGRPLYEDALYLKANAHLRLMHYAAASHILEQLVRINPKQKDYSRRWVRCLYLDKPNYNRQMRAAVVVFILSSAVVILLEILFVNTLHLKYAEMVRLLRNILLGLGLGTLVMGELLHWFLCERRVWKGVGSSRFE